MKPFAKILLPLLAGLALLAGCKKELDDYYQPVATAGYFVVGLPNATLSTTSTTAFNAKYAPGETIPIIAGYNLTDNPTTITVFQATKTDSAQVGSYPIGGSFLQSAQLTAQTVPYTVPTTYPVGTSVRVDLTLTFPGGGTRLRRFTYQVANAPTLAFGTPAATYRNGLSASAQAEGDLIGYAITINAGGISTSTTPATNLFKNVDSLVYYARVGATGPLLRQGVIKAPTAGVENKRTIDLRVPSGAAAGGGASFVFTAYAQYVATSLSTAVLPVVAGTPLKTTRTGRLAFGGGVTTDSLAFNLVTGLNEPAANAATAKDLQVSGLSSAGNLTVNTSNTTRYYKLTAAQLAANPYATATANMVGALLYQNTPSADLGTPAVGDVYAVKLRGTAEVMLLRVLALRASTNGGVGRIRFEYRSL
ncbi:hypothetical protein [Hymenobacter cheonanensis]|uniref:hypothetical protein n=1 Tax=Hymenobacter sp. CA2-7 TaxID=3063993 RepID=UPI0027131733|nr:hypothetical protein [Hymenobacter sp. CA2-7]MDO7884620.1 hypothetical protein [Hymenobacter sp. CA2-7]